jgi:hypothetical protein
MITPSAYPVGRLAHLSTDLLAPVRQSGAKVRKVLIDLLVATAGNETLQHELQRRSWVHSNGFLKTVLVDIDEWERSELRGHKLVLHTWDHRLADDVDEEIHDHRWPFWSLLLVGQLRWEHYSLLDLPGPDVKQIPCTQYEYRSPGASDHYQMTLSGAANLMLRFSAVVGPETSLAMTEDELHRVSRVSDHALTLVLQGVAVKQSTRVFVPGSDHNTLRRDVYRPPYDVVESALSRAVMG